MYDSHITNFTYLFFLRNSNENRENESLKVISELTGREYENEDCHFFGNAKQSAAYKLWGAELIDLIATEEMRWIFVFTKTDHNKYKIKWNNL